MSEPPFLRMIAVEPLEMIVPRVEYVGEVAGFPMFVDPDMPPTEVKIVQMRHKITVSAETMATIRKLNDPAERKAALEAALSKAMQDIMRNL